MKTTIQINAKYVVDSMPMVENYRNDEGPVYALAKWSEHGAREIVYGERIVMPIHEFEREHIVQTWLVDPNGDPMTARRKRLMGTQYLKRLIKNAKTLEEK